MYFTVGQGPWHFAPSGANACVRCGQSKLVVGFSGVFTSPVGDATMCDVSAAAALGRIKSPAKAATSRTNGKLGGSKPGRVASEETKRKMSEAQKKRREGEKESR